VSEPQDPLAVEDVHPSGLPYVLTMKDIMGFLQVTRPTAYRRVADLKVLGLKEKWRGRFLRDEFLEALDKVDTRK